MIVEENVLQPCPFLHMFLLTKIYAKMGVINIYLQILLLNCSPQLHVLGICDVQSDVLAIVFKYRVL